MTSDSYITPEIKDIIGSESVMQMAADSVSQSEIRRFVQAVMDSDPCYWSHEYSKQTKYRGVVCPPLFPLTCFRTSAEELDPVSEGFKRNADFDGAAEGMLANRGLPDIPVPLDRRLNGGNEIEIYQLAKPGDRLVARSRIANIYEKKGQSGLMVFIVTETTIWNQDGAKLLTSRQTLIRR